ncbi:pleckstrin homology domain-containing family G member 3 isoform X2 [Austrofundulus limnaeus]|uniref:Pleckstrin homology domain-containing family G member 3 isoform X2 n=1 Tax=Austrofundulus limnaeus TaxID=52670 RepID=A0A2I4CH82_AUSLI|nr:PREDICTED: pleckstrin homology domain-containing family G member 3 isoform X2 [Austrofundulus limnaeus]
MGYQRRHSLAGGGVAVVRCSCSEEEVRISFRSRVDERRLRRVFLRRWFESPRLSNASISSDERAPSADASDPPPSGRRPVSLISTQSSGYGSSRDDYPAPPQLPAGSSDVDPNQNLSPAEDAADPEGPSPQPSTKSCSFVHSKNGLNKGGTPNRASSRRQPFISATMAPNPQLTYLDRVIMEIIESERMYVRDLRMIVEDYLAHIIDQSSLSIHPEQVCALFGNIEDIYEFNSELLHDLDLCENDPVAVARCFVVKSDYFEIYTQYCTNYPNSVAALTECMRNKSLAKFFRDRQASLKRSLPLGSYLLKPVQRILKYHLLLQEIAKHFDPEEEGYEVVEEAIYTMTGVAWYINDMKRKHEHAVRLQEVQSLLLNWKGPDLCTFGELVLEGTFKVPRAKHERTLFLFDRMLLITKRREEHYVYKTHISSSTLMLIESAKDSLSFSVTHYKHPKQPQTVQAKTVEEKKLWAHHIKRIILENHHAVIPQKAKEAILEMDSIYPPRYRYSPERLKKPGSDEFPRDARYGRRQSEPTKQMMKNSKAELAARLEETERGDSSSNRENGQLSESNKLNGSESTPEQQTAGELEQGKTPEKTEDSEPELSSDPASSIISVSPQKSEDPKPEENPDPVEEPSCATTDSDSKTLSSGESSEDERDAHEESGSPSILPSSVLDKASDIAQHFSSIKRGSLAQDDARSISCASPRLPSRTSSILSLSTEVADRPLRRNSVSSEPPETFNDTDLTLPTNRDDGIYDPDRSIRRRRDSTLSKQDQILIGKIKTYYENAGNQDATFSIRRRESLTYIPTGLVRSSVSRLNNVRTNSTASTASSSLDPPSADYTLPSSLSLDSLKSDQLNSDSGDQQRSRSQSLHDDLFDDEEFRPSSEMIKVWQEMEQRITDDREFGQSGDVVTPTKSSDPESGASDLSTITEDSTSPSPPKPKAPGFSRTGSVKNALRCFGEEAAVLKATVPRVAQLRAEAEGERPGDGSKQTDDVDKGNSKVLSLARRYSQLIKTTKPTVQQRNQTAPVKKSLACVVEEKENSGKSSLSLPLVSNHPDPSLPLSPADRSPVTDSSRGVSPGRAPSRSPLSPSPPVEVFTWPDVRELRSKYSIGRCAQRNPVSRSRSIPEKLFIGGQRRHSSGSSLLDVEASGAASSRKPRRSRNVSQEERSKRLHRANSLDPRLSGAQMSELQRLQDESSCDGYYISAEAPLTDDPEHKIIIMEKLPNKTAGKPKEDDDGSYVQIRSPTSREKISIMAVIDRCRAYQESDEYKQREEAKTKSEPGKTAAASAEQDEGPKTRSNSGPKAESSQGSIVKNLREKFQSHN